MSTQRHTLFISVCLLLLLLLRLVHHLSERLPSLAPDELVSLLLMVYFKGQWRMEDLLGHLDPVALQDKLAALVANQKLTNAEVCACALGKGMSGVHVKIILSK